MKRNPFKNFCVMRNVQKICFLMWLSLLRSISVHSQNTLVIYFQVCFGMKKNDIHEVKLFCFKNTQHAAKTNITFKFDCKNLKLSLKLFDKKKSFCGIKKKVCLFGVTFFLADIFLHLKRGWEYTLCMFRFLYVQIHDFGFFLLNFFAFSSPPLNIEASQKCPLFTFFFLQKSFELILSMDSMRCKSNPLLHFLDFKASHNLSKSQLRGHSNNTWHSRGGGGFNKVSHKLFLLFKLWL